MTAIATRSNGKQLASVVRLKDAEANWARSRSVMAKTKRPSQWQVLECALDFAAVNVQRVLARVDTLEAELAELRGDASVSARAMPSKPVRISLVRDITDASVRPTISKIENARGRDVILSLETRGGDVGAAFALARAIEEHGRVECRAVSACSSAGLLVYAAGYRRSCLKGASFHIHAPTLDGREAATPGEARRLNAVAKRMATYLGKRAGMPAAHFLARMTPEGETLDGVQLSNLGLLNGTIRRPHKRRK
jgi:ATP-dependent protease ClpP protease subunit